MFRPAAGVMARLRTRWGFVKSAVVCVVPLSAGLSINTLEDDRLQEIGHNLLRSAHRILCNSVLLGTCVLEVLVVSTRFGLTVLDL